MGEETRNRVEDWSSGDQLGVSSPPTKRSFLAVSVTLSAIISAALIQMAAGTIAFLWTRLLGLVWRKKD